MSFTAVTDFQAGKYILHTGMYDDAQITAYINEYEEQYLTHLLGKDLYDLFMADIDVSTGLPVTAKYLKIYEPLKVDHNWSIIYSDGMKDMLKGFVYFEYVKDMYNQMTPAGLVKPVGQNSQSTTTLSTLMYTRYNTAIRSYKAIQEYILDNRSDYPDFNGYRKFAMTWL